MNREASLTIAIPLHKASRWFDTISKNIDLFPMNSKILISDRTLHDDTLKRLSNKYSNDSRITFIKRPAPAGWREHANFLIKQCKTKYFSIMPQDDSITKNYYEKLVDALDQNPSVGVSFGIINALNVPNEPKSITLSSPKIILGQLEPHIEAISLYKDWNLGIPYRGVIRKEILKPIPKTPNDLFADLIWVFGHALKNYLIEVPDAIYIKNYHSDSAHANWKSLDRALSPKVINKLLKKEIMRRLLFHPIKCTKALSLINKVNN